MTNKIIANIQNKLFNKGYEVKGYCVPNVFSLDEEQNSLSFAIKGAHNFLSLPKGFGFAPFEETVRGPVTFISKSYDEDYHNVSVNEIALSMEVYNDCVALEQWVESLPKLDR